MTTTALLAPPADDFPNRLLAPEPTRVALPRCGGWLIFLVSLCLVLRCAMAARLPGIIPDAPVYIDAAKALQAGDMRKAFPAGQLNLYPTILAGMHSLGFDWESGGVVWGVGMACAAVLPLFGWLRRQYDQQVAIVACVLYAFHSKLIEWAPEILRDSTFWFLLTLSVYLLWRAVTEVRLLWFAAASLAILASVLTRFEGLILVIPLALWSFWRWRALRVGRKRLIAGLVLSLAVPALLLLATSAALRGPRWLRPRMEPLARAVTWTRTQLVPGGETGGVPRRAVAADGTPMTWKRMLWVFFPMMTRGLSPIFALLMFGGIWGWRRTWARRDNNALFLAAMANLAGIWIQLWYDQRMCHRYALGIALLAMPFAALGVLGLAQRLIRIWNWSRAPARWRPVAVLVPLAAMCAVSLNEVLLLRSSSLEVRRQAVEVGRWMARELGPEPVLVGPSGFTAIVHFYAQRGAHAAYRQDLAGVDEIRALIDAKRPDVAVIACTRQMTDPQHRALAADLAARGFVGQAELSFDVDTGRYEVLVRRDAVARAAGGRSRSTARQ